MKIGYARVYFVIRNVDRQIKMLNTAGVDRISREKASTKILEDHPQLDKAIDGLGTDNI